MKGVRIFWPSFQRLPEGETTKERWHELCQEATAGKAPERCALAYRRTNYTGATLPFSAMKKDDPSPRNPLAISCPTCGAAPGEKCQLISGQPRTEPHRDRRLLAKD